MGNTAATKHELDMTTGKLMPKMVRFAIPLMLTGILQLLFSAADMVVVGQFVGDSSLAAIGSTNSLINLIVNLFIGFGVGAGVVMSRCYGAKDGEYADTVLHTAMLLSVIAGIATAIAGSLLAPQMLSFMNIDPEYEHLSVLYVRIYFLGAPANLIYNFGAALLRSTGDTKRPLIYLTVAGIANVIVNIIAVIVFDRGVDGVAIATILSQAISAVLVVTTLVKSRGFIKLKLNKLRINRRALKEILRLGIPSGISSAAFSISNVIIQSSVNEFGTVMVAGNAAASSLEGFAYTLINSVSNTAVTVAGQNFGARKYDRIKKSIWQGMILTSAVGIISGGIILLLFDPLVSLYTDTALAKDTAFIRLLIMLSTYWICGIMEIMNGVLRGIGYSVSPMLIVLVGTCLLRVVWITVFYPLVNAYWFIFISYPITWAVTGICLAVLLAVMYRKSKKAYEISRMLQKSMDDHLDSIAG